MKNPFKIFRADGGEDVYPLVFQDDRAEAAAASARRQYVFDIDKTYLETPFEAPWQLLKVPFEFAIDKKVVAGMPELIRNLRRGAGTDVAVACVPIYFVSASPPQLRYTFQRRMMLDGVEYDGFVLKDWSAILKSGQWQRLKQQIGFKLAALLTLRLCRPLSQEILFGDDFESDPIIYQLYSRMLQPGQDAETWRQELMAHGVSAVDCTCVLKLWRQLPVVRGRVDAIYIRRVRTQGPQRNEQSTEAEAPTTGAGETKVVYFDNITTLRKDLVARGALRWP